MAAVRYLSCRTCGCPMQSHHQTPDGKFPCSATFHGETTRGVIGIPFSQSCGCDNYVNSFVLKREHHKCGNCDAENHSCWCGTGHAWDRLSEDRAEVLQ